jgi:hypothetical protein
VGFLLLGLQGVAESLRLRWRLMHGDVRSDGEQPPQGENSL